MSFIICHLSFSIVLSSCGDLFEFEGNTSNLNKITLNRHTLYLMAGDTYQLTATFEPDTLRNKTIYWMSNNVNVATFDNGVLVAVGEGETTVTGISIEHQCTDTCHVVVGYGWYMPERYYPFDMVVNADITVNGKPLKDGMQVAAFVGSQIRGIGVQRNFFGISYTEFRIYSLLKPYGPNENQHPLETNTEPIDPEKITFRAYDRDSQTMYECTDTITFDGMTHGYPSNLYRLSFK